MLKVIDRKDNGLNNRACRESDRGGSCSFLGPRSLNGFGFQAEVTREDTRGEPAHDAPAQLSGVPATLSVRTEGDSAG